jgi:D-glycero-alpha-D-manno-heptose-7-phosphate kinase
MPLAAGVLEHVEPAPPGAVLRPRVEVRATARAPLRISLAGGGTDVPPLAPGLGGRVVAAALGLHVRATVEPFDRGWVRLEGAWGLADAAHAAAGSPAPAGPPDPHAEDPSPALHPAPPLVATVTRRAQEPPATGVAFRLLEAVRAAFGVDDAVRITIESDLTPGTGLGGSAAAAVSLLAAFHAALGRAVPPQELATHASLLERETLGLRCGLQDQLCSAEGGVLDLRFFDDGFSLSRIDPSPDLARDLASGLLLLDTRIRRVSGEILDVTNQGRARPVSAQLVAAAEDTARGFRLASLPLVLAGMRRSAAAKLRRGGPSALPLDWIRKLASLGAVVVRACGAGGGGHVLLWADPARHPALIDAVSPCVVRRPALGVPGVTLSS